MYIYDLCKKIIQDKCVKPVKNVTLFQKSTSFHIHIQFEDKTEIIHKLDRDLQHFVAIMQHIRVKKEVIQSALCIPTPLGYHNIFGFVSHDTARFSKGGEVMLIYFL